MGVLYAYVAHRLLYHVAWVRFLVVVRKARNSRFINKWIDNFDGNEIFATRNCDHSHRLIYYTKPMIYDWTSRESPRSARFIVTVFIHAHKTWLMRNTNNNKILFFYYYYRRVCVYASILYLLLLFLFCPIFGSHELWTLSGRESRGNIAAVRLWHVENKKIK